MGGIFVSRFTPNLKDGREVSFVKGEKVIYRLQNGSTAEITIDSDYMKHTQGDYGYEAIFSDDNKRYFALSRHIIDWEGRLSLNG